MTEAKWVDSTDLDEMLRFLTSKASERKLRLFAVACCRRIWRFISEQCSRHAVKISERYADGRATFEELETAFFAADRVSGRADQASSPWENSAMARSHALDAARLSAHPEMRGLADGTASAAAGAVAWDVTGAPRESSEAEAWANAWFAAVADEVRDQVDLLRCIFGNPFHPITLDPSWPTPTVKALAQSIYDDRTFDQMPSLADELERAGYANHELLSHCRGPGQHVRGCWVVDVVLGKG